MTVRKSGDLIWLVGWLVVALKWVNRLETETTSAPDGQNYGTALLSTFQHKKGFGIHSHYYTCVENFIQSTYLFCVHMTFRINLLPRHMHCSIIKQIFTDIK